MAEVVTAEQYNEMVGDLENAIYLVCEDNGFSSKLVVITRCENKIEVVISPEVEEVHKDAIIKLLEDFENKTNSLVVQEA